MAKHSPDLIDTVMEALVLRGLSFKETARELEIPVATVRAIYNHELSY